MASRSFDRDIYVDTLLGMYFEKGQVPASCRDFIILDFDRIFVYQRAEYSDAPGVNSLIQYLIDDYPVSPLAAMATYAVDGFHFLYPLEVLEILPTLWARCHGGGVITADLVTPEIRIATVPLHPECVHPQTESSLEKCLLDARGSNKLQPRITGRKLRMQARLNLDELVSPDTGIVRTESKSMGRLSFPTAVSRIAVGNGRSFVCSGRTPQMTKAVSIARCEAVERHLATFLNPQTALVYGTYELFRDVAIDPGTLCYTRLRVAPSDNRAQYSSSLPLYWCTVHNLRTGKASLAPAQEIWFNTHRLPGENVCIVNSTSGCALGTSFEEAALFAILEIIERDSFLTTWYLRRPCMQILPKSIPSEEFQLIWHRIRCECRNYSIHLFDITTDLSVPVVLCVAAKTAGAGRMVVLSTACRLHVEEAALAALKDLVGLLGHDSYDEKRASKLLERPEDIFDPEDHAAFYSMPENFDRLSFLRLDMPPALTAADIDQRAWIPRQSQYDLKVVLETIAAKLCEKGIQVFLKEMSNRTFGNLSCVKAILPESYPMWFGYYYSRFRLSERFQQLAQQFLGHRIADTSQINLDVHPFN